MSVLARLNNTYLIFLAWILVSIWLGWQGYIGESIPYGDVSFIYEYWGKQALFAGYTVGIDEPWVYPILAIIPIIFPALISPESYALGWILLVTGLNGVVLGFLSSEKFAHKIGVPVARLRSMGWVYLGFLIALGPISVSRLDSVVSPLVVLGMLIIFVWPANAGAFLSVATWIKVWPAAVLFAAVIALKQRAVLLVGILLVSIAVIGTSLIIGGGNNLLSFLGDQTDRGLQIESPIATPLLWFAIAGVPGYGIYYDDNILTYQVAGELAPLFAAVSNILLGLSFIAVGFWTAVLRRRNTSSRLLIPIISLILILLLVVFNKVGSPQYEIWLLAPVIAGLVFIGRGFMWHALIAFVIAILTQIIYPYNYVPVLYLEPLYIGILTLRNALLVGFAVYAIVWLYRESKREIWAPTKSDSIKNAS